MQRIEYKLIEKGNEGELPSLVKAMKCAFDDDTQKHLGEEAGGPAGYDNGDFFRQWLFGAEASVGWKFLLDGKVIGGMIVWVFESNENCLGVIFIDPDYQDQGLGKEAIQWMEAKYPDTKVWRLETPEWQVKNRHFYGKTCGYKLVGQEGDQLKYEKVMK